MQHHPLSFPPEAADLQAAKGLFQALSDPTRLLLLLALQEAERPVHELVDRLGQPQSTISRHLATLRHAGLVVARRDAQRVHYRLADAHLGVLLQEAFSHAQHQRLGLPDHPTADRSGGDRR